MDERTIKGLGRAAKQVVGIDSEFPASQNPDISSYPILRRIHQYYIDWDDPKKRPDFVQKDYNEAEFKRAEAAIKKFRIALRDCGYAGEQVTKLTIISLENALEWLSQTHKRMEEFKKWAQEKGIELPYTQNRGDRRLRVYVTQMACWYIEFVGDKPGRGTYSIFPELIESCLVAVDEERAGKPPPTKIIRNVLELLDKPYFWNSLQAFWKDYYKDIFATAEKVP